MNEELLVIATALWLGILTSISPCPLASNIAAVSFVGRGVQNPHHALVSGFAYVAGRSVTYVLIAVLVVSSVLSVPGLSMFLQHRMNQVLGPLLVLIGAGMLHWIRVPLPSWRRERPATNGRRIGPLAAGALGLVFALSFCPVSAGLFFGALIPLAINHHSRFMLPLAYGMGTGLPVAMFAILIAIGAHQVGRAFDALSAMERVARRATGVIFLLAGGYLMATHLFGLALW